jgi:low affinity Fe/Cu permease
MRPARFLLSHSRCIRGLCAKNVHGSRRRLGFRVRHSHYRRLGDDGPTFHYSDTWQLIINTGTTIVIFLMVFLIQNTQNRDAKAVHLKLDELIRALGPARNKLVNLENLSDDELEKLEQEFEKLREKAEGAKEEVEELKSAAATR